ncbi:MAG TPA: hypothetical protein VMY37_02750 [Thermoguttaceae bacterium]|nr:hypothetical protein [Thermoguttaceae bacterium]
MSSNGRAVCLAATVCVLMLGGRAESAGQQVPVGERARALRGSFGTYNGEPRREDGHVDVERLVSELAELKANTYHWLIWHRETDWEDLQRFLPLARQKNILVWVCLVPPSESPPHTKQYSEPFRLDYQRWAVEIAKLSLREPNLVAWSVDDFTHNLGFFTPEYLGKVLGEARKINPNLAFVPCSYSPRVTPQFAEKYGGLIDGILFPYRAELTGANLTDSTLVDAEVATLKKLLGPSVPVIVDVYASAHSRLGSSTPEYVEAVMNRAIRCADGVHVYCHHSPRDGSQKAQVIKRLFHEWSADSNMPRPQR